MVDLPGHYISAKPGYDPLEGSIMRLPGAYISNPKEYSIADILLDLLPIVGDYRSAVEAKQTGLPLAKALLGGEDMAESGPIWGEAGLAGLGAIPLLGMVGRAPKIVKGVKAVSKARKLDKAGDVAKAADNATSIKAFKGAFPYDWDTYPVRNGAGEVIKNADKTPKLINDFNFPDYIERRGHAGFFAEDPAVASRFAELHKGAVFPTELSMSKPKIIDMDGKPAAAFQFDSVAKENGTTKQFAAYQEALQNPDYDGIIIKNTGDEGTLFVPKTAGQIRMTLGADNALDMSTAARMKRAEEMGFDTSKVWFHGTDTEPQDFTRGAHRGGFGSYFTDSPTVADNYAFGRGIDPEASTDDFAKIYRGSLAPDKQRAAVVPVYLPENELLDLDKYTSRDLLRDLDRNDILDVIRDAAPSDYEEILEGGLTVDDWLERFNAGEWFAGNDTLALSHTPLGSLVASHLYDNLAKIRGLSGVKYTDAEAGGVTAAITDPTRIRSIFAKFDPTKKGSSDLLAGLAPYATLPLAAALMSNQDDL